MLKFNKTLIQKDRGGFQNGPWNGHFEAQNGARRYFTIHLHFHKNGTVDGYGQDQIGKFKVKDALFDRSQMPHTFKARLKWDNRLDMAIAGVLDQATSAINGTFSSSGGDGSVTMQPTFTGINDNAYSSDTVLQSSTPPSGTLPQGSQSTWSPPLQASQPPSGQSVATQPALRPTSGNGRQRFQEGGAGRQAGTLSAAEQESIESLIEMGFDRRLCELAVHNAGTREAQVEWIYNNLSRMQEQAQLQHAQRQHAQRRQVPDVFNEPVPEELVQQLVAMGFDTEPARVALRHHNMDVSAAAEYLLAPPVAVDSQRPPPSAGYRRPDQFANFLSDPPEHTRPPAALVQQLMEVVQISDEQLAATALMQNDNDLELAINWILEGGSTSRPSQGMDDFFSQPASQTAPGGHRVRFSNDEENALAVNRRRGPAPENDLFGTSFPAAKPAAPAAGGFDDFFSNPPTPPAATVPSTSTKDEFDLFASDPAPQSGGTASAPPKRAAPAPPKRAPPAPPKAAAGPGNPLAGPSNPLAQPLRPPAPAVSSGSFSSNPLADQFSSAPFEPFPATAGGDLFSASSPDPFPAPSKMAEPSPIPPGDSFAPPNNDLFPSDPFPAPSNAGFSPSDTSLFPASTADPFGSTNLFPETSKDPFPASSPDPFPAPSKDPFSTSAAHPDGGAPFDPFPTPQQDLFAQPQAPSGFFSNSAPSNAFPTHPVAKPKPAAVVNDSLDDFLL